MADESTSPTVRNPRADLRAGAGTGLRIALAALSFLVIISSGLAWATYQDFTAQVPRGNPVPALAPGATDIDGDDQNILLIGNDTRVGATEEELRQLATERDGEAVNTDTMMLLHIPADGRAPTMISFPRDAWVEIPENGKGKLNSAYGDGYIAVKNRGGTELERQAGGINLLIKTISLLTGLHIDHYLQVNLLGFYRISNAIGGVDVCLKRAQNPTTDRDEKGAGYSGINLPAGWSTISGTQALAFVRQRHGLPGGDLDRIARQQYFLAQAFKKIVSAGTLLNPFKLGDLMKAVSSSLLADPDLDLMEIGRRFATMSAGKIAFRTIPHNGSTLIYPDGVETAVVEVDQAAIVGFVKELQGKPADPNLAGAAAAAPGSVTVDVLNGTDITGRANRNAEALRAAGFKVDLIDSATPVKATVIKYPEGQQGAAKAVLKVVPGATLVLTGSVEKVTLVLGFDGLQVSDGQPAPKAAPTRAAAAGTPSAGPKAAPAAAADCVN